jgi:hypothetical protein
MAFEPKKLEALGDEFHRAMGYCVAEWANVDENLFLIFRDCVGPYDQSAILYYRLPGLEVRFGVTDELVRSLYPRPARKSGAHPHPHIKAWNKARKGYQDLLAVRRRIAHQPNTFAQEGLPHGYTVPNRPIAFEIYVNAHERLREREAETKPLRLADLQRHLAEVTLLRTRLFSFFSDVLSKPAQEPDAPNPQPPQAKAKGRG